MEKTLLESNLEKTLLGLEMPLGERIYSENVDFEAEIEDLTTIVKSTDDNLRKLWSYLKGELYKTQLYRGSYQFLSRKSGLYKWLGFIYSILAGIHETSEKNPAKNIVNEVISERDFGKTGSGSLDLYYDPDISWQLELTSRNLS